MTASVHCSHLADLAYSHEFFSTQKFTLPWNFKRSHGEILNRLQIINIAVAIFLVFGGVFVITMQFLSESSVNVENQLTACSVTGPVPGWFKLVSNGGLAIKMFWRIIEQLICWSHIQKNK